MLLCFCSCTLHSTHPLSLTSTKSILENEKVGQLYTTVMHDLHHRKLFMVSRLQLQLAIRAFEIDPSFGSCLCDQQDTNDISKEWESVKLRRHFKTRKL